MTIVNTYVLDIGAPAYTFSDRPLLMAVLTEGEVEDYAVYEGIVPAKWKRQDAAEFVAREGTKCSYKRATSYFPSLPESKYRS